MVLRPYQEVSLRLPLRSGQGHDPRASWRGQDRDHADRHARHAGVHGEVQRFLVVAPKRVAVSVWPAEAKLWAPTLLVSVVIGTPTQRVKALQANVQVVVATYDNLQWLAEQPLHFDGVVFDELTRLKNPSGKRFKALIKVLDAMRIRWGLTGSFTSNGLEDVFGQCKVIDQSLLGRSQGRVPAAVLPLHQPRLR
jgi:superfamily II DNA or RNA helicase